VCACLLSTFRATNYRVSATELPTALPSRIQYDTFTERPPAPLLMKMFMRPGHTRANCNKYHRDPTAASAIGRTPSIPHHPRILLNGPSRGSPQMLCRVQTEPHSRFLLYANKTNTASDSCED